MNDLLLKRRIKRHEQEAERAKALGDRERFWQERRAMLLAQAELWNQQHARTDWQREHYADLPY